MDWSKFIAVNGATAHPHYDPDGTVYNMGNSYGAKGQSDPLQGYYGSVKTGDALSLHIAVSLESDSRLGCLEGVLW